MRFVKISSIVFGLLMLIQWLFFLASRNVPELQSAPVEISFHLAIEFITAILLIFTGFSLQAPNRRDYVVSAFAQGMLAYTVVNSAGHFAQNGQYAFMAMFAILLIIAVRNLFVLYRML
jgi:hypothetical protein